MFPFHLIIKTDQKSDFPKFIFHNIPGDNLIPSPDDHQAPPKSPTMISPSGLGRTDSPRRPEWQFDEEEVKLELDTIIERLIISRLSNRK